jgi:uncharacterized membrane protein
MSPQVKRATLALLAFLLAVSTVMAAYVVWKYTTKITVLEPFEVKTNLPTEASLYPGSYSYWINVTNHGGENLNATLYYTITAVNCTVEVSPPNGTSYKVEAGKTVSIPVTVTISLDGYPVPGSATIDWWIERVKP